MKRLTLVALLLLVAPAVADTARRTSAERDAWRDELHVLAPEEIGRRMADGERVLWVDVREPQEYAEFHVPGAMSVPLRNVNDLDAADFADADLVIPYCLKDFRGYEGARKLKALGVPNVGLAEGFGINSWKRAELPVAGVHPDMTDAEALEALARVLDAAAVAGEAQPVVEP